MFRNQEKLRFWRNKRLTILLLMTLFISLISACALGSSQSSEPSIPDSLEEPTAIEDGQAKGGHVIVGISQEPDFLDPYLSVAAGTKEIMYNVFEGLVKLGQDGSFIPGIATEWTFSDDGLGITFTLREDVSFHDGTEMTIDDVVYSIKRGSGLLDGTAYIPALEVISDVVGSADGKTVQVSLEAVRPEIMIYFAAAAIVPEAAGDLNQTPIGTGPFKFESYRPQQALTLTRFDDYWGAPAYLDRVTFTIVASTDSAMLELQAGSMDIFPYLTAAKTAPLTHNFNIMSGSVGMTQLMALNNSVEPLNNQDVRRALSLAIDRTAIIALIGDGHAEPIYSALSPVMSGAFDTNLGDPQNIEEAKRLLDEAGMPDGFELSLTVPSNYTYHMDTASVLASQLAEIGVDVSIEAVNWGTWLERVYQGRDYEATIVALTPEFSPLDAFARFRSEADDNFVNYKSDEFDKLYQDAEANLSDDERNALYYEMQTVLYQDGASVFIQDPYNIVAVSKALGGYTFYPKYVQDMASVYFIEQADADDSVLR